MNVRLVLSKASFTTTPEFCKSKVTPNSDRDGGSNQDNKLNLLENYFI